MDKKIFFEEIEIITAEFNNKWKNTDKRRKIFYVKFNNGSIWYPKWADIDKIYQAKKECYKHNIQFSNIDKKCD